jgi:hypothetical protein
MPYVQEDLCKFQGYYEYINVEPDLRLFMKIF